MKLHQIKAEKYHTLSNNVGGNDFIISFNDFPTKKTKKLLMPLKNINIDVITVHDISITMTTIAGALLDAWDTFFSAMNQYQVGMISTTNSKAKRIFLRYEHKHECKNNEYDKQFEWQTRSNILSHCQLCVVVMVWLHGMARIVLLFITCSTLRRRDR